jgi:hypothetical protein
MAKIFVGKNSLVVDIFCMVNIAVFVKNLEYVILCWGAMDKKLILDSAKVETSKGVAEILKGTAY